ncbi:MAG: Holliday junction branch migration protein RuvA [Rhodospirillaceae bacterium]|nr:Holliday junction branch migration protein RuvA [Rhodospirillaceae bacterium]
MIASLSGTLKSISKSEIVLEVNNVGYLLNVSSKVISTLGDVGSKLSMFTDLQVKDDKIIMYGFFNQIDQTIFRLLQSVQGVGPKAALSILSALTVEELILAISSGDKAMISRAEGVGSKVAGRIATELLEKVSNLNLINTDKNIDFVKSSQENLNLVNETNHIDNQVIEDAISALVNLGYSRSEVFSILMKIKKEFSLKHETKEFTVGNIIPLALNALTQVTK